MYTALSQIKTAIQFPDWLGKERPYARFCIVNEAKDAGADADVEYCENAEGRDQIVITISEWSRPLGGSVQRGSRLAATFDVATGEIVDTDDEDLLNSLLVAVSDMRLVVDDIAVDKAT